MLCYAGFAAAAASVEMEGVAPHSGVVVALAAACLDLSRCWLASQTMTVALSRNHLPQFARALRDCGSLQLRLLPEAALLQSRPLGNALLVILALMWDWQGIPKKPLAQQTSGLAGPLAGAGLVQPASASA